ncbi:VOC family protein [Amycolatopsis albispora]|uniref:Glyoxalase n=1 Tax=Amycolatopsis albispora TaxID=1804986 RepID=A0A344LEY6_9PSEU|nr:VOC family protein [Amycolatopsis albispora]AXB46610.1 glyoxalase [Amycolatopsis albispora]
MTTAVPTFGSVVLDCADAPELAAFYAKLLDWPDADGDEQWRTLSNPAGGPKIEFQRVADFRAPDWPSPKKPQQFHLDLTVTDLAAAHERALHLGARLLDDSNDHDGKGFRVYADPAGHPFCLCAC